MPFRKLNLIALAITLTLSSIIVQAEERESPSTLAGGESFYKEKSKGWFWYEEPPPEKTPPSIEPPKPVATKPQKEADKEQTPAGPAAGSVAWIKANLPKLREIAIDDPSDENIEAYFYTQRLMMDKSERFSRRSMEVIRNDPFLDEDLRYPASNAASDAIATAAGKQKNELMKMVAANAGIIFFFNGENCPLCEQTVSALQGLEVKFGFNIIPVSLDGKALKSGAYPRFQYDNGLAKHLGIITAPALALAVPPTATKIISYSAISMDTAVGRILYAAKDTGLITPEEFGATSRLATVGLIDSKALADAPTDFAQNKKKFVARMREEAARAYEIETGEAQ